MPTTMENVVQNIKARCLPTNPNSDLFNPISHPRTQCVSPVQLSSLSLLLWHHQSLPRPLTIAPRIVPGSALAMISASTARGSCA
ncbi:hypothetical protein BDR05DRAFT_481047 [Suillus weaverae]|nr:hypothetical protein BDR05DRAFT_481047 [Suillus weaverae]